MSQSQQHASHGPPKTERWVLVMALAFLPVIGALFTPESARIALVGIGGLTFIAGFILMYRESRRSRDSDSLRRLVHADSE